MNTTRTTFFFSVVAQQNIQKVKKKNYLQKATLAIRCIHQCTNFELFETQSQHPVSWCTTKTTKTIPTCHRTTTILICHFRRRNVLVDVNSFIAMIFKCFGWTSCNNMKRKKRNLNLAKRKLFIYLSEL